LFHEFLKLLDVEQVWDEIIISAELQEGSGNHDDILLLYIFPADASFAGIQILMDEIDEQLLERLKENLQHTDGIARKVLLDY